METPANLKYTKDHEWIRAEGNVAYVGITDYAQSELGEIVYVDVESEGETLEQDDVFGAVEAVKTTSDLLMPVSGTVTEINPKLEDAPELINESPYEGGWIIKVELSDPSQVDNLMDAATYKKETG